MRMQHCMSARNAARAAVESGADRVSWDVECCSICREAKQLYCANMIAIEPPEQSPTSKRVHTLLIQFLVGGLARI